MQFLKEQIKQANEYTKDKESECKAFILTNKLNKIYSKARYTYNYVISGELPPNMSPEECHLQTLAYTYFEECPNVKRICENLNKSTQSRTKRLKNKVGNMITFGECVFVTLTFDDEILDSTNELTRRKYVSRFLKSVSDHYIANIDYGTQNEREHYHAVVFGRLTKEQLKEWREKCGLINVERVKINSKNEEKTVTKVSKYISKLTNHAIKNTTKGKRMIYSRNFKDLIMKVRPYKLAKNDITIATGLDLFGDMLKVY